MEASFIKGFSKLTRDEKIRIIASSVKDPDELLRIFDQHRHPVSEIQAKYESFSENTFTNYYLPFGIAPNFLINNKICHIPMVTEESSVIAAAASAARFWFGHGGFSCKVPGTLKKGQVYFEWKGESVQLFNYFNSVKDDLSRSLSVFTDKMESRGGGIREIQLVQLSSLDKNTYKLDVSFETADAMGANFINTCLEKLAENWVKMIKSNIQFSKSEQECTVIMGILSNYNPECIVYCSIEAEIDSLDRIYPDLSGIQFAEKLVKAFKIAQTDVSRAVTHNKGIMNGVDAVLLATGNDFRAVEAGVHAYAARNGNYTGLSMASIKNNILSIELTIPLILGTVGGLTTLHPVAQKAFEILDFPSASELMMIVAAVGLANNFSAVKALITGGIQQGHMKMHLTNILDQYSASSNEKEKAIEWFQNREISNNAVQEFLINLRN